MGNQPNPAKINPAELRKLSKNLVKAVTSPEFLAELEAVIQTPAENRLTEAANRLTPAALRSKGIDLPQFTRTSSRYFDETHSDPVELSDETAQNILIALNKARPGVLNGLDPELIKRLGDLDPNPIAGACVCAGGGPGWSVCIGVGF